MHVPVEFVFEFRSEVSFFNLRLSYVDGIFAVNPMFVKSVKSVHMS